MNNIHTRDTNIKISLLVFVLLSTIMCIQAMQECNNYSRNSMSYQKINKALRLKESTVPPIIVIFERHWDRTPKKVIRSLIPLAAKENYTTLCCEVPHNTSEEKIITSQNANLKNDQELCEQVKQLLARAGCKQDKLWNMGFESLDHAIHLFASSQSHL